MDKFDVPDNVIDFLHAQAPNALCDEVFVETLTYFCLRLWGQAIREERRRMLEALRNPRTFEMN